MAGERALRTEVKPEVVFLGKLLERVHSGKIRVPRFQRPFVWRHEDMKNLLDSVLHGFPIGSILVWNTDRKISSLDRVGPVEIGPPPEHGVVSYVLDGHQRISTLLGALMLPSDHPGSDGEVDWRIYFDLETSEFLHEPRDGLQRWHFPVRSLLTTNEYIQAANKLHEVQDPAGAARLIDTADFLVNAFRNYQLPLVSITEADLDSAVTVFSRLNRRGRKMTEDQMVSALTYQEGSFHLADRLDSYQQELKHRGFGNLERVFLLRSVLAAMDRDIYAKDFAEILVKKEIRAQLPATFDIVEASINLALDFLGELGVTSDRLLPYGLQLVLLAEYFRICPKPSADQKGLLERWFWVTSFTGWFGRSNSTLARRALEDMQKVALGERTSFEAVDVESEAQPFPERFDGRSARVRAFLLFLSSLQPRSVTSPDKHLATSHLLSELGTQALAYVVSQCRQPELTSSPANRMFADHDHQGQVVGVLEQLARNGDGDVDELLQSHGFPPDAKTLLAAGEREGAILCRLEYLIESERTFMSQRSVTCPTEKTASPVRDSDTSEDE